MSPKNETFTNISDVNTPEISMEFPPVPECIKNVPNLKDLTDVLPEVGPTPDYS